MTVVLSDCQHYQYFVKLNIAPIAYIWPFAHTPHTHTLKYKRKTVARLANGLSSHALQSPSVCGEVRTSSARDRAERRGAWPRDPLQAWLATGSICCACCPRACVTHRAQTQRGCQHHPAPLSLSPAPCFTHNTLTEGQATISEGGRQTGRCTYMR